MNNLIIMIFVTLFLATCLGYFMYQHWMHIKSLERCGIFRPVKRAILLIVSFVAPSCFIVFIMASVGLI